MTIPCHKEPEPSLCLVVLGNEPLVNDLTRLFPRLLIRTTAVPVDEVLDQPLPLALVDDGIRLKDILPTVIALRITVRKTCPLPLLQLLLRLLRL